MGDLSANGKVCKDAGDVISKVGVAYNTARDRVEYRFDWLYICCPRIANKVYSLLGRYENILPSDGPEVGP